MPNNDKTRVNTGLCLCEQALSSMLKLKLMLHCSTQSSLSLSCALQPSSAILCYEITTNVNAPKHTNQAQVLKIT